MFDITDIAGNAEGYRPPAREEVQTLRPVEHSTPDPDEKQVVENKAELNATTHAPEGLWTFDAAIDERNGDKIMITAPENEE